MLYFWCLGMTSATPFVIKQCLGTHCTGMGRCFIILCIAIKQISQNIYIFYKRKDSLLWSVLLSTVTYVFHVVKFLKLLKSALPKSGKIAYSNQTLSSISIAVVHTVYALHLTGTRNYCKIPIHFSAGSRRGALNHAWFCFCAFVQCLDALVWLFCYFENHLSWNKTVFWYLISNL